MMRAALLIPSYNHGTRLAAVLADARSLELPVFVVDDGSTDHTASLLAELAKDPEYTGLTVLRHAENRGKGASLQSGFAAMWARGFSWALCMDADGQHRASDGQTLLLTAEQARENTRALIIGARQDMAGEHVPWTSRAGRGFSNFWVRACGGPRVADSQSGFRLYPLPECLHLGATATRYQFEVEILVRAGWQKMPVLERPISVVYQKKGERISHFQPGPDFWRNSRVFARLFFLNLLRFLRRSHCIKP